ncbi:MAG TPA: helix-turn-helix transcriptional regulator [Chryseosolibacter sp.]
MKQQEYTNTYFFLIFKVSITDVIDNYLFLYNFVIPCHTTRPMLSKDEQSFFYKKLGESIRASRIKEGCKQEVLAQRVGLTRISIVNIEQGKQKVQLHVLIEIAVALNTTIEQLVPTFGYIKSSLPTTKMEKDIKKELEKFDVKAGASDIVTDFVKLSKSKS